MFHSLSGFPPVDAMFVRWGRGPGERVTPAAKLKAAGGCLMEFTRKRR